MATVVWASPARSALMSCPASGEIIQATQAQQRQGCVVAALDGHIENQLGAGLDGEPAVFGDFPTPAAPGPWRRWPSDTDTLRGPLPYRTWLSTSREVVISSPPGMVVVEADTGSLAVPIGSCSTKPRSVRTGPPMNTGCSATSARVQRQLHPVKRVAHQDVGGFVDHQTQRTALAVFTHRRRRCGQSLIASLAGMAIRKWLVRLMEAESLGIA